MAIQVTKKEGESAISLVRRFQKTVQQSGILLRARSLRFYKKPQSKRAVREKALRRIQLKQEREKSLKLGLVKKER